MQRYVRSWITSRQGADIVSVPPQPLHASNREPIGGQSTPAVRTRRATRRTLNPVGSRCSISIGQSPMRCRCVCQCIPSLYIKRCSQMPVKLSPSFRSIPDLRRGTMDDRTTMDVTATVMPPVWRTDAPRTLRGARQAADYLGWPIRRVFRDCELGRLPHWTEGKGQLVSTRRCSICTASCRCSS